MTVEYCYRRLMQMRETTVCQLEDDDYADVLTHDTDVDVFNMAIEALEKQIPKKTIPQHDFLQEYEICPICNRNWGIMVNYCPECGQRLER